MLSAKLIFLFLIKCESFMSINTGKNQFRTNYEYIRSKIPAVQQKKLNIASFFRIFTKKLHVKKIGSSPPAGRFLYACAI